ncbi:MAG: Gfo/Idh/MocA family oxidoreductase [Bacteroidota bacterium]
MLRLGVLGVGHLGKIHLKCAGLVKQIETIGFFDPDPEACRIATEQYGIPAFPSMDNLFDAVDAIDIVTPTSTHFELAQAALLAGKHVFMEKPATETPEETLKLIQIAGERDLKVQVGHVERFNPALMALQDLNLKPMFIEAHRLSEFNPRGTDVSVVQDIMIHDLDIVLSLVRSPVRSISASGVAVVSESADIANARIEFDNGCVANLTASRMSMKRMRKIRLFQRDAYISVDFLKKESNVISLHNAPDTADNLLEIDTGKDKKWLKFAQLAPDDHNAIELELRTFAESILNDQPVKVGLEDAHRAISLSRAILQEIEERNRLTR